MYSNLPSKDRSLLRKRLALKLIIMWALIIKSLDLIIRFHKQLTSTKIMIALERSKFHHQKTMLILLNLLMRISKVLALIRAWLKILSLLIIINIAQGLLNLTMCQYRSFKNKQVHPRMYAHSTLFTWPWDRVIKLLLRLAKRKTFKLDAINLKIWISTRGIRKDKIN